MNRLDETLARAMAEGRSAFIAYITCGDPTLARTKELVRAFMGAGVDVMEFGVPFSDPMADGTANQEAAIRALEQGVNLADVLETTAELRREGVGTPIVLFTYYNPVFVYGLERFVTDAAKAGVDGVLLVDVPPEEAGEYKALMDAADLKTIFLVSPTTDEKRLPVIVEHCSGFVYYVSRAGVTGERASLEGDLRANVAAIHELTDLPVAVGFGISSPEHVKQIAGLAEGVIVGSAIVGRIGRGGDTDEMVRSVGAFVRELTEPLRGGN